MIDEAEYVCDRCGERIVVTVDVSAGAVQSYVEDCPVCCHPHVLTVELASDGQPFVRAEAEQDRD